MKKTPIRSAMKYCDSEIKRMTHHMNEDQERNLQNAVTFWQAKITQMEDMRKELVKLLPVEVKFAEQCFNAANQISDDPRSDIERYQDDLAGNGNWETKQYKTFNDFFDAFYTNKSVVTP
jgi:hypothetical protein